MPGEFLDSNILLYLTSSDENKAERAEWLLARSPTLSVQVLNEFTNVAPRKFGRAWPEIDDVLARLRPLLSVEPLTESMHIDALRLAQRYRFQWWDALIAAAALGTACNTLYSEDMQTGLLIDGRLRIVNPFAPD